jgi:hypothetical protein
MSTTNDIDGEIIARFLACIWKVRKPNLAKYLFTQLGYDATNVCEIKRLIIANTVGGDVVRGDMGGLYYSKWVFEDEELTKVSLNYMYKEMYDTDASGEFYLSPSFLFCFAHDTILLSERYGSRLKIRLRGKVVNAEIQPIDDWVTLWSTTGLWKK